MTGPETLAFTGEIFGIVGLVVGGIVAAIALAGPIVKRIVRSRKANLWKRLPAREEAWNEGYDAALADFPCTNAGLPKKQSKNPYTGYDQAGAW